MLLHFPSRFVATGRILAAAFLRRVRLDDLDVVFSATRPGGSRKSFANSTDDGDAVGLFFDVLRSLRH